MGPKGWLGIAMATAGLLAAAISALPTILDSGQDWSGPVAGAGFAVAFVGLLIGASDDGGRRRRR